MTRKKCKRVKRSASPMISKAQLDRITITPRLHLEMICQGNGKWEYAQSVASILNVVAVMAFHCKNFEFYDKVQLGNQILIDCRMADGTVNLSDIDSDLLKTIFCSAERYISLQTTDRLYRAIDYIDQMIANKVPGDVIRFPGYGSLASFADKEATIENIEKAA